ncbi:ABC transporter permease subunit [Rhodococcus sp. IEGM 1409]|uniref:ABC transporter permease subunit n=1 Tax=Rhodococcus sp. IEGM 1409 TaxID=3047082 RepID=UPI0024B6763F|nr:ABC transporter permease subunit [Rhodococcus sp. IEGM 1409]MDI9903294.1 ABC transporter permease subunit [Rhodococcus sp. IEGM 1409]
MTVTVPQPTARQRSVILLLTGIVAVLLAKALMTTAAFPAQWRLPFGDAVASAADWFVATCDWLYQPVGDAIESIFTESVLWLQVFPDILVALVIVLVAYIAAGPWIGALAVATVAWVLAVNLWVQMLETIVLMGVAAAAAAAIGIGLGIVSARGGRIRTAVIVVLDGMQTIPVLVYLLPVLLVFGPGDTAALLVTLLYAVPPAARMTDLGIRTVADRTVESAVSLGVTKWQLLIKVQLPLARPSIMAGVNQTIMAAMAMAVIAAMIGASGLGQPVWRSLNQLQFGAALEGGVALVLLAILLDRISANLDRRDAAQPARRLTVAGIVFGVGTVAALTIPVLQSADFTKPLAFMSLSLRGTIDDAVQWLNVSYGNVFDALGSALVDYGIAPVSNTLNWLPWPAAVFLVALAGTMLVGWKGGLLATAAVALIGLLGTWSAAISTISILGISVVLAVLIGIPVGVAMSASDGFAKALRPVLDTMQTLPIYLVVIPAVILVGSGPAAGVLATILYCMPPVIRLTNVAIREVEATVMEAANSLGASRWQLLRKVQLPMGSPTILVGVNQTIMLAMAMAVVSAFVGTPGLGSEILVAISRVDLAKGIEAGVSMLILAVLVDRISRAVIGRLRTADTLETTH